MLGENLDGVVSYPVEKHLWYTDKEYEKISEDKKYLFIL